MAEINELKIKLVVDDTEVKNLEYKIQVDKSSLTEFEIYANKIFSDLEKNFTSFDKSTKSSFSKFNFSDTTQIPTNNPPFQMSLAGAPAVVLGGIDSMLVREFIFGILSSLIMSAFGNVSAEKIINALMPFFEAQYPPDLLLDTLEARTLEQLNKVLEARRIVEEIGNRPDSSFGGIPLDETEINEQIELIKFALGKIDSLKEEINNLPKVIMPKDVLQIPIDQEFVFKWSEIQLPEDFIKELEAQGLTPELSKKVLDYFKRNELKVPIEQEIILTPTEVQLPEDFIRELETQGLSPELSKRILDYIKQNQELRNEIERGNNEIQERSQALPPLENLYANLGGPLSMISIGEGMMSDAMRSGTVSAAELGKKGIDPLAEKVSTFSGSFGDVVNAIGDGTVVFGYVVDKAENANETLGTLNSTTGDLSARSKELADEQEHVTQAVADGSAAMDNAGASAEQFGDTLEQVENSGGFFDGIKQGFIDFVDNVESNSELMADFFANTLTEMSQNFSDLFYNVLTGRFDNLKDLAKQAFEAILRSFLDLVSAIATRQIVISIGGLFGLGKGAQAAGGGGSNPLDLAQQGAGVIGSGAGLFGSGGAFATLGAGLGFETSASAVVLNPATLLPTGEIVGPGFLATAGSALTIVGAVLAAAALVATIVLPLLKKTPRFAFKFESVETEVGERAAQVKEFLDADFFSEEIFKKIVGRGGGGAFSGKEVDELKKAIQEAIAGTIKDIQAIINKLPQDMAELLNEALLNTAVDTETKIGRSNLLGFDAKGSKNIKEKLEKFFQGDLQGRFIFAVRDFFQIAFEQLGVLPEKASAFIDAEFERFKNAGSPEERAAIGQEFLASFNAFVDAFNIVSGNVNDAIGQTLQNINALSSDLGFKAVPSIGELREELGKLLENAEIDAETVQAYADLRNAIVSLMSEITSAITGLIGKINQLNTTIVSLGGSAVDTTGFLNTAATQLQDFLGANMGNLSLSEQEGFLDQLLGIANDMLAQEQAAFAEAQQAAREAAEKAAEAQRAAVQQRIDGLNAEKERVQDVYNERIEALNEELRIAEGFAQLTESIRRTLDSILYSPESVLTGVEQVNALQTNVAALQQELAGTTDPERQMEIAGQLEEAFKTLFGAAGDAFGVNSPEYVAIFDQVTGGLAGLAEMTESRARTVEEINAEIERLTAEQNSQLESIDAKIEAAQEQLSAIGTQEVEATFQASDRVKELFEYIRTEYMRILEERFAQLEEASVTGFATELEGLQAIAGTSEESLVTLREQMAEAVTQTGLLTRIADTLGALSGYDGGSGGLKDFGRGTLAVLHGKEAVVTEAQVRAMKKHMALAAEMTGGLGGALGGALETFAESIEGTGPVTRLGRELVGAGRLTELADRIGTARITSMMEEFAGASAGGGGLVERLAEKLNAEEGHISGLARRAAVEEVKNEMSVAISVNVNGGSGATVAGIGNEIENMLVRSIKQGGKLRSAIQDAGAKRMG